MILPRRKPKPEDSPIRLRILEYSDGNREMVMLLCSDTEELVWNMTAISFALAVLQ